MADRGRSGSVRSAGNPVTSFAPDPAGCRARTRPTETLLEYGLRTPTEIAVDADPSSPSDRDLYVPTTDGVDDPMFARTATSLGELHGFGAISTVAVDPTTGGVYVGRYYEDRRRL